MKWPGTHILTRAELGALGERHAARLLRSKGMRIIEANYRVPQGEIDLIAREGDTLVIVEVRTRTSKTFMSPFSSVNDHKQAQVARVARHYRLEHKLAEVYYRFDVVEVIATPEGKVTEITHYPGAFSG